MKCTSCQTEIPADAAFCPECGTPVAKPPARDAAPPRARTFSGLETVAYRSDARPSAPTLEPGTVFAGRYGIARKIGEGGMGVVYVATDRNTGEEVVLKLIHPDLVAGEEAMKRLVAEGVMARQIRHPNIVAVYDVGNEAGQPYLTMEYVKGGTLRTFMVNAISGGGETSVATAVGIVRSILAGLSEAHRMGVVHRDLKPENILLAGDPAKGEYGLKILDFGIAKGVNARPSMKSGASSVGTPLYMAPEQTTAADAVGPAADLYSLSVIFYELLMEAVPQSRWEPPSEQRADVPKALDKVIERGLSTRARSRYQSTADYLAALDEAMPTVAPQPAAPEPQRFVPQPEPAKPEPAPPAGKIDPPAPKPPPTPAETAAKNKRMLIWGGVAAAIIVLGLIGNALDTGNQTGGRTGGTTQTTGGGTAQNTGGGTGNRGGTAQNTGGTQSAGGTTQNNAGSSTQIVAPPPPPPPFFAAGAWYDDSGNLYQITQNGSRIAGSGFVFGGPARFDGVLTRDGLNAAIIGAAGQSLGRVEGIILNAGHISYSYFAPDGSVSRGCFHINHMPSPPCVNGRL